MIVVSLNPVPCFVISARHLLCDGIGLKTPLTMVGQAKNRLEARPPARVRYRYPGLGCVCNEVLSKAEGSRSRRSIYWLFNLSQTIILIHIFPAQL